MSDLPRCPATGKTMYPGKARAKKARVGLRAKVRIYRCESCRAWHLTKSTKPYEKGSR